MRTRGFQKCPDPFGPRYPDTVENCEYSGSVDRSANTKTGLLERQIQTWGNTSERFQRLIIERIKTSLEARIAQERGKHVERTAGYSNDDEALRQEFGIDLEPEVSESAAGSLADPGREHGRRERERHQRVDLRGAAAAAPPRGPVDALMPAEGADQENEEESLITIL